MAWPIDWRSDGDAHQHIRQHIAGFWIVQCKISNVAMQKSWKSSLRPVPDYFESRNLRMSKAICWKANFRSSPLAAEK